MEVVAAVGVAIPVVKGLVSSLFSFVENLSGNNSYGTGAGVSTSPLGANLGYTQGRGGTVEGYTNLLRSLAYAFSLPLAQFQEGAGTQSFLVEYQFGASGLYLTPPSSLSNSSNPLSTTSSSPLPAISYAFLRNQFPFGNTLLQSLSTPLQPSSSSSPSSLTGIFRNEETTQRSQGALNLALAHQLSLYYHLIPENITYLMNEEPSLFSLLAAPLFFLYPSYSFAIQSIKIPIYPPTLLANPSFPSPFVQITLQYTTTATQETTTPSPHPPETPITLWLQLIPGRGLKLHSSPPLPPTVPSLLPQSSSTITPTS